MSHEVLLLGASGTSGRHIATELVNRGLPVALAGRDPARLDDVRAHLSADVATVVVDDPDALTRAVGTARLVVNTVGPFARLAAPVIDACLAARVPYVDIANELPAVRALLARHDQAVDRGIALVTAAGFGSVATESLVLYLAARLGRPLDRVIVAAAQAVAHASPGVRDTIQATLPEGAARYVDGQLVHDPLGTGATTLTFGGGARSVLPVPVGDLETARLASGAGTVVAYGPPPGERPASGDGYTSYAYAEATARDGRHLAAQLRLGEGFAVTAAIAAETAWRILAGATPGAWTPGRLFGADLVSAATGASVENVAGQPS